MPWAPLHANLSPGRGAELPSDPQDSEGQQGPVVGHISGGSTLGTPTPAGLQPNPFEGGITAASYVGISPGAPALPGQGQGGLCLGCALSSLRPSTGAPNLPLLPSVAAQLTPLLLGVLSPGAGAMVATRIKKQAMMGLRLAASPSSLPEPLQCSQATPAFLSVWLCAHRYCLQSYTQLPAGRYAAFAR